MADNEATRDRLTAQAEALRRRIDEIQKTERRETAEGQTDDAHLWQDADLRSNELDEAIGELKDVDTALSRLDEGTYGTCARCDRPISRERLEVLPTATLCASCASRPT